MINLYAWASLGENGKAKGGKLGNQNGKELKIAPWYDFGQTHTIRFKSKSRGRKCARIMKFLCKSRQIGYAQDTRFTLYDVCAKYDWNWAKIKEMIESSEDSDKVQWNKIYENVSSKNFSENMSENITNCAEMMEICDTIDE